MIITIIDLTIFVLKTVSTEVSNCQQMCLNMTKPLMINPNSYGIT